MKPKSMNSRYRYPEWYTNDLIGDIKIKSMWHRMYKESGSISDYNMFAYYRSVIKRKIEIAYETYQRRIEAQFQQEPQTF